MKLFLRFLFVLFLISCKKTESLSGNIQYEKEIENLTKLGKDAIVKIEEVNKIKINDSFSPVFVEKAELIKDLNRNKKNEEFFVVIKGWAIDPQENKPLSKLFIKVNNTLFKAEYGIVRKDVLDENISKSGFECKIPVSEFGFLPRQISVICINSKKKGYYENNDILWISVVEKKIKSFNNLKILENIDYCLDTINDSLVYKITNKLSIDSSKTRFLSFSGWATDPEYSDLAGGVYIIFDETNVFQALYGLKRIDVAEHFNKPQYMYSGFSCLVPVEKIGKGKHSLKLYILNSDYTGYYVAKQKFIVEIY
jgi:hypothetical protein